jgi:hypothetical protein
MPKKTGLSLLLVSSALLLACGSDKTSAPPGPRPQIGVSSAFATFEAMRGASDPQPQSINVTNSGTGSLDGLSVDATTYGTGQPGGWLTAVLEGSLAPAILRLSATLGDLPIGQYTAQVRLKSTASGVTNSPQVVTVNLIVLRPPTIQIASTTVGFSGQRLAPNPAARTVAITNSGTGTLSGLSIGSITYGAGQPTGWLAASLNASSAPATMTLSADVGPVPVGAYSATVEVKSSAPLIANSPQTIAVTLSVQPARPRLSVVSAPATGQTGTRLSQSFQVQILDGEQDVRLTDYTSPITASMLPGGALSGRLVVTPTQGTAVFDSLIVNAAGTFTVAFDAPGAARASGSVTVAPPPGGTLVTRAPSAVILEPNDVWRLTQIVEVRNAAGALVSYPVQVQAGILRGAGLLLSGDTTTSVAGLATFALQLSGKSDGFTAEFVAPGFASGTRDYFPAIAVGAAFPSLLNARDTVVRQDSIFIVDQVITASSPVGLLRFDVHWNPSVLSLLSDSVMISNATVVTNHANMTNGTISATLNSSGGVANLTRFLRMRFKVIGASQIAVIETLSIESRTASGTLLLPGARRILQVRIP